MSGLLCLRNRQRARPVHLALVRRIARSLFAEHFSQRHFELCVHLVGALEMARLNERFLGHPGSTDVITFNYAEYAGQASRLSRSPEFGDPTRAATPPRHAWRKRDRRDACPAFLHGEIFISVDDAVRQARQFRTSWQAELVRYLIHGLLHLHGHDDLQATARRRMKREEDRLLREVSRRFDLNRLEKFSPLSSRASHR